jgi:hypothetical protein
MVDTVIKKINIGKDTCPLELYQLLQKRELPYAIVVLKLSDTKIELQPKGTRISDVANVVSTLDNLMELRIAMRCVLSCISELHKAGFVHREIQWPNIINSKGWIRSFYCY